MKIGDTFPVSIQGIQVAAANVTHVDHDRVTLRFEGAEVVIGTRTQLADEQPEKDTTGTETIITGVDRVQPPAAASAPVEAPPAAVAPQVIDNPMTEVASAPAQTPAPEGTAGNPGV